MKTALITGVNGQDGAYLTDLLLEKAIWCMASKGAPLLLIPPVLIIYIRIHMRKMFDSKLHYGDLTDGPSLIRIIQQTQPDEIYNLGAMSHVKVSFENPEYTANADGIGTLRILEAYPHLRIREEGKTLPGFYLGAVWFGTGNTPKRNNSFLSTKPVRCSKIVRLLDHC
jgi:GDPmannose 4,6-dehydratase